MNRKNNKQNPYDPEIFDSDVRKRVGNFSRNKALRSLSKKWFIESFGRGYVYNFYWFGIPIVQTPQDMVAMQELIYSVKPDLIIETGIARGGSLIFYASLLKLLGGKRKVIGIDININRENVVNTSKIRKHKFSKYITMLEGSSTDPNIINRVKKIAKNYKKIFVCLDSAHSHGHVLKELQAYSDLVSRGSYIVIFDTVAEYLPRKIIGERPWGKGNSPATAVKSFLSNNKNFVVDSWIENKILITSNPGGFLKRIR
ncbi:MAG: hypothetical protein A2655_01925 [Candidatus Yanofskybacteria bacterium RIFCSPHIGHO2_01_FULL_43_42]|uniref:Uncharacterized protein n=1 Tax=Candidatus Yanofskybacteria bacterium RIFCSPLOWO2_01_FULL_43_22 TaxID=1802695 RepID=A0A1F8GJ38_9BACT|nr:MAG: hypothetical protein A2655_01925 [Candidatus Yanofskybacteria bacterium RIFCSPHIGHO2_01_FULL_43_42]OGN13228.1 MAG: hypothetical protein A3D48_02830 [Candidatus Yanofskybacteria bacterium RIFCSPHIGHO2_02_FULL_43_17]OGN24728.1 MAG: hypothetical protein A3A13_01055 [Candidatus Yanofskybacteria bacterium RIFCSPLOWO2_01_FULL_43_22]